MTDQIPLDKNEELLLEYIQGLTSEEVSIEIETAEEENPAVATQLQRIRKELFDQMMAEEGLDSQEVLKESMQKFEQETGLKLDPKPNTAPRRLWYAVAAVLIPLIGLSFWSFQEKQKNSPYKTFAQMMDIQGDVELENRGGGSLRNLAKQGINALREDSLNKAIEILGKFQEPDSTFYYDAQYHLGKTFLANGKPSDALKAFDKVSIGINIENEEAKHYEGLINWYQALAHYKNENYELARQELTKFRPDWPKAEKANALLEKMDNPWFKLFYL